MTDLSSEHQRSGSAERTGRDEVVSNDEDRLEPDVGEAPENLPPKAWVTLVMFAAFVVLFGTCAKYFLFS